jgi:hypothetical protein
MSASASLAGPEVEALSSIEISGIAGPDSRAMIAMI